MKRVLRLIPLVIIVGLGIHPAHAVQPNGPSPLVGRWIQNGSNGGLAKIVINENNRVLNVHPYGSCSPTLCDWGVLPALGFSTGIGSNVAVGFEAQVSFSIETVFIHGHLIREPTGKVFLEITTQTVFLSRRGEKRRDYELTADYSRQ